MRDGAITEVARLSNERKTGARGLRAILESSMMEYMYELPSREDVTECIITKDVITGEGEPKLLAAGKEVPALEKSKKNLRKRKVKVPEKKQGQVILMSEQQMKTMPILAMRDVCVLPGMLVHLDVSREITKRAMKETMAEDGSIFITLSAMNRLRHRPFMTYMKLV